MKCEEVARLVLVDCDVSGKVDRYLSFFRPSRRAVALEALLDAARESLEIARKCSGVAVRGVAKRYPGIYYSYMLRAGLAFLVYESSRYREYLVACAASVVEEAEKRLKELERGSPASMPDPYYMVAKTIFLVVPEPGESVVRGYRIAQYAEMLVKAYRYARMSSYKGKDELIKKIVDKIYGYMQLAEAEQGNG